MADIALLTANKIEVIESLEQMTLPAAEAITAGMAVRMDVTNGRFTKSNATVEAEGRMYGIATKTVAAGEPVTAIRKGVMDGWVLDALAHDQNVYLSDTDGRLADAVGTINKPIGRVAPGAAVTLGTALDKILLVDLSGSEVTQALVIVTSELLAASVDKWIFVADRALIVRKVREVHSALGGAAAAVRPRKVTDASLPGAVAGATVKEITAAGIDMAAAAANVVQSPALVAGAADYTLAAGDKIGLDFSGDLTALVGLIEIVLEPV